MTLSLLTLTIWLLLIENWSPCWNLNESKFCWLISTLNRGLFICYLFMLWVCLWFCLCKWDVLKAFLESEGVN